MPDKKFEELAISVAEDEANKVDYKPLEDFDVLSIDKQEALRFSQDTRHRAVLVWWMIILVSIWLLSVLLFASFNKAWCLNISDNVLITLLATTTINVLGLSKIILGGLFGNNRYYRRKNK
jgi:hypothetical protein